MKNQSFRILISSFILLFFNYLNAQTSAEDLQTAMKEYYALNEKLIGFDLNKPSNTEIDNYKLRMNDVIALLEKIISKGNPSQIKAARFHKTLSRFDLMGLLHYVGEDDKAYELIKPLESDLTSLSNTDFPIEYDYSDKYYSIKWENILPIQAQFYAIGGAINYNVGQYNEAYRNSITAINHPNLSNWLKYLAVNRIFDCEKYGSVTFSSAERLDYASRLLDFYQNLSDSERSKIYEVNTQMLQRGLDILMKISETDVSASVLNACAKGAKIGGKFEKDGGESVLQLYKICYVNKYSGNLDFHQEALAYAKRRLGGRYGASKNMTAQFVGLASLDALMEKVSATDCSDLKKYPAEYRYFDNTLKAEELELRIPKCEQKRIEEAKAEARRARRANRYFSVYLGLEPFPLLASGDKIDIGGHMDLRGRRVAHSFGVAKIQQKSDLISAKQKWDGIKAFYAFKVFGKSINSQLPYTGLYFGYADKEFKPIDALIIPNNKNIPTYSSKLTPLDKQYELLWNSGMQILGKFLGGDVWFGVGGAYHQLSYDEKVVINDNEISGHDFFEKRKSENQFTLLMRLGLSIGLNFGDSRL